MGSLFASGGAITRCRTECDAIFSLLKYVEDEESSDPDAKLDKARVFVRAALLQAHALRVAGQVNYSTQVS